MKTPLQKRKMKQLFPTAASPASTTLYVLSGTPTGSSSPDITGFSGTSTEFPGEISLLAITEFLGVEIINFAVHSNSSI